MDEGLFNQTLKQLKHGCLFFVFLAITLTAVFFHNKYCNSQQHKAISSMNETNVVYNCKRTNSEQLI